MTRGLAGRLTVGRLTAYAIAVVTIVACAFPVYLMLLTSILPDPRIRSGSVSFLPREPTLAHYRTALSTDLFVENLRNSLVIATSTTLATIVVGFLAAAALGRFRFRGRTLYLVLLLVAQMIPLEALVIPIFLMLRDLGRLDQYPSLVAVYLVFNLPFAIWTLRSFVVSIPVELEEQAMVDGCSRVGAFWRVLLPLVVPGLVATAVYAFIQTWSELLYALVIMQDNHHQTLPVWIGTFTTVRGTDWGGLMAGSAIFTLPVMVFFLFVYRRIATGLAAGAVKG